MGRCLSVIVKRQDHCIEKPTVKKRKWERSCADGKVKVNYVYREREFFFFF